MKNQWAIDPMHSEIEFKVKHLMISTVTGKFKSFTASAETEGDEFEGAQIKFSADINSIDTSNEQRDGHLKSDDFFNAEAYPTLSFVSTSLTLFFISIMQAIKLLSAVILLIAGNFVLAFLEYPTHCHFYKQLQQRLQARIFLLRWLKEPCISHCKYHLLLSHLAEHPLPSFFPHPLSSGPPPPLPIF